MPNFVEAELKNRLWLWLEKTQDCEVWPEVKVENGRIDLYIEKPNGERWGIEVKGTSSGGINMSTIKQIHKYIKSDSLDRIFFASYEVDKFYSLLEDAKSHYILDHKKFYEAAVAANKLINQNTEIDQILTVIEEENPDLLEINLPDDRNFKDWIVKLPNPNWVDRDYEQHERPNPTIKNVLSLLGEAIEWFPHINQVGTILVPLNIEQAGIRGRVRINENLSKLITSQPKSDPVILREAKLNSGEKNISPNTSEMTLHHFLWRKFGGIPEGALPNPESGNNSINIDLISFKKAKSATDVLESGGKVIGIEAKTNSGLKQTERLKNQLIKYTKTGCLTNIYLAVPSIITSEAHDVLNDFPKKIESRCGVIGIESTGDINIVSEAESIPIKYDGYGSSPEYPYYVGYGNSEIPNVDPKSIFPTQNNK